jgi:hypothetical protein
VSTGNFLAPQRAVLAPEAAARQVPACGIEVRTMAFF